VYTFYNIYIYTNTSGGVPLQEVATNSLQEVVPLKPTPNTTSAEAFILPEVVDEPVGARTRSSGPSDNLSIKKASNIAKIDYHYDVTPNGKIYFQHFLFFLLFVFFFPNIFFRKNNGCVPVFFSRIFFNKN
jgi:hypothetical protein